MFLQVPECVLLKIRFVFIEMPRHSAAVFKLTTSGTVNSEQPVNHLEAKKLGVDIC